LLGIIRTWVFCYQQAQTNCFEGDLRCRKRLAPAAALDTTSLKAKQLPLIQEAMMANYYPSNLATKTACCRILVRAQKASITHESPAQAAFLFLVGALRSFREYHLVARPWDMFELVLVVPWNSLKATCGSHGRSKCSNGLPRRMLHRRRRLIVCGNIY
jgi:hypothetical protein